MDLEERTGVEDNLEQTCEVCGVTLSDAEIEASRETGGRFLCSTHAEEETPVVDDGAVGDQPDPSAA
jgi:hypothetical protein